MLQETIPFDSCLGLAWSFYEVLHYFESPKDKEVFGCLLNNLCKASDSKTALRIHLADQTWSEYYGACFSKARFKE